MIWPNTDIFIHKKVGYVMWNQRRTDSFRSIRTDIVTIQGYQGDDVHAYTARPTEPGSYPGLVLVHHLPGWDEFYRETARRFADHGYIVICPDLYERFGHSTPENVTAKVRSEGGVKDESVVHDCRAAFSYLKEISDCNGKVGIIGTCSGGRHSYLVACLVEGFNAVVDLWGGGVVAPNDRLTDAQPVAPVEYTKDLSCPVLGIFGNEDQSPSPIEVGQLEEQLKLYDKKYEFHRYDGASHGFWYYDRPMYRQEQAIDSWNKTFVFLDRHLA